MSNLVLQDEVLKALLNIVVAVVTLGLGWLVGQRLTVYWAIRQKRRELELSAVNEFYRLYGEFFAVWKLWENYKRHPNELTSLDTTRWTLLERACAAEGALEAIFVKLSSERALSDYDIETLGRFRQAYQKLRESISHDREIGWWSSNHPEYLSFKHLAYLSACVIVSDKSKNRQGDALKRITENIWEIRWVLNDDDWQRLETHYKT